MITLKFYLISVAVSFGFGWLVCKQPQWMVDGLTWLWDRRPRF